MHEFFSDSLNCQKTAISQFKESLDYPSQVFQIRQVVKRPECSPLDPEILSMLRNLPSTDEGCVMLEDYIQAVLYDPVQGYYQRPKQRVGHRKGTDFYTASSLGPLFSKLVIAGISSLTGGPLENYVLVELGPESPGGILGNLETSPFGDHHLIRPGDPIEIPPKAIVFSNELFDAQPFRRFVRRDDRWKEMAVSLSEDRLSWREVAPAEPLPPLPDKISEGYVIDWPGRAHALMDSICRQSWEGLFMAFDYGLDRSTVFTERPEGTGRTYTAHRMGHDLLENPGHIDITCHLIWEELEALLRASAFEKVRVQRQEAFFMQYGQAVIKKALEGAAGEFSREKQTLMELLHPDNMGHKFQVLSGRRGDF
jgi:SAM-dependent MidA family methyltransferase